MDVSTTYRAVNKSAVIDTQGRVWLGGDLVPCSETDPRDLVRILSAARQALGWGSVVIVEGVSVADVLAQADAVKAAGWTQAPRPVAPWTHYTYGTDERCTVSVGLRASFLPFRHYGVLYGPDTAPAELARRLDTYRELTGHPWHGTAATSAQGQIRAMARCKVREVRTQNGAHTYQTDRPVWHHIGPPLRDAGHFLKWVTPLQPVGGYCHTFDGNAAYLGAASTAHLAVDALQHREGPQPFDDTLAGWWRINPSPELLAELRDPYRPPVVKLARDGTVFATTPLIAVAEDGRPVDVIESWTSPSARILRKWAETIRDGLVLAANREGPKSAVVGALKRTYSDAVGGLQRTGMRIERPDWGHTIIEQWRATLIRRIRRVYAELEIWPVAVSTDSITYHWPDDLGLELIAAVGIRPGLGGMKREPHIIPADDWWPRVAPRQRTGGRRG